MLSPWPIPAAAGGVIGYVFISDNTTTILEMWDSFFGVFFVTSIAVTLPCRNYVECYNQASGGADK
jgi:hypothetical protein